MGGGQTIISRDLSAARFNELEESYDREVSTTGEKSPTFDDSSSLEPCCAVYLGISARIEIGAYFMSSVLRDSRQDPGGKFSGNVGRREL